MSVGKIKKRTIERRYDYQFYFTAVYGTSFIVINSEMTLILSVARPIFEAIYIQAYYFKTINKDRKFKMPI